MLHLVARRLGIPRKTDGGWTGSHARRVRKPPLGWLILWFNSPLAHVEPQVCDLGLCWFSGNAAHLEVDPVLAVRIMVDIAIKALSAAISDPTTAVQAMNHLAHVLRQLGSTQLRSLVSFVDKDRAPRLLMPGRSWEDYLMLAVTEIREYGAGSIQVMRRPRAMLQDLEGAVRPEHRPAVGAEIARLDATLVGSFGASVDKDRAQR